MKDESFKLKLHEMSQTIKNLRDIYGISQSKLAKLMGVSRNVIADIEQEKRFPEMINILKLCEVFEITEAELCSLTFQHLEIKINVNERVRLNKEMYKSTQKTIYENAMEWRRGNN